MEKDVALFFVGGFGWGRGVPWQVKVEKKYQMWSKKEDNMFGGEGRSADGERMR